MIELAESQSVETLSSQFTVCAHRGGLEVIDQFADEWQDLCQKSNDDQPFYRPEWIRAYLRAFTPGAQVALVAARSGGRLRLLLPLVEEVGTFSRVRVRKMAAPINLQSVRFDATRYPGPEGDAAVRATWEYLRTCAQWDLLQFNYVPEGGTVAKLVAMAEADNFPTIHKTSRPNPQVRLPENSSHLNQMPRNARLRTKLRQARRELAERGTLSFHRVDAADPEALERFYKLESSGWKGEEGSAIACDPAKRQFFDEIADSAARRAYFCLYLLEWNGQLMAAHFALVLQDRCYSPKVAYDEKFKEFAPGHLIVSEILKDCVARGIRVYDITGDDDDWKMKWTIETRPINHHLLFTGRRGYLAYAIGSRLRPAVHRLLPRRAPVV